MRPKLQLAANKFNTSGFYHKKVLLMSTLMCVDSHNTFITFKLYKRIFLLSWSNFQDNVQDDRHMPNSYSIHLRKVILVPTCMNLGSRNIFITYKLLKKTFLSLVY